MYFTKFSLAAIAILCAAQGLLAAPSGGASNKCKNFTTHFSKGIGKQWKESNGEKKGWKITSKGLEMRLEPPHDITRLKDSNGLPYNKYASPQSPNFESKYALRYGRVTFNMQTSNTPGAVTCGYLISPTGDEIDLEMLGGNVHQLQTNYFYGKTPIYSVNGGNYETPDLSATFHNYTIDWTPERMNFLLDGKILRTTKNNKKCNCAGDCEYPTHAAYVQIGIWDSSSVSGTTQWALGPIDWKKWKGKNVKATIKSVTVECDPKYNDII